VGCKDGKLSRGTTFVGGSRRRLCSSLFTENLTMAQLKNHKEKKTKKFKAKTHLFATISSTMLLHIMSLKSAKAICDYLKREYEGDDQIKSMQMLNLIRDFE